MRHRSVMVALLAAAAVVIAACGSGGGGKNKASGAQQLTGLFRLAPGTCTGAGVMSGSSFRMINPGGKLGEGPFISNGDSPCGDKTYSPMSPGSDGGLRTGAYQPETAQPFDAGGNGVTESIAKGTPFFAVRFAVATNQKDPQTGANTTPPTITVQDGKVSGDLSAFAASWNNQHFNQGSPKPGAVRPGLTAGPTGSYDPATKKYTLEWSSQIVGGPFNNFTGVWHFEGTFEPKA
ncbi:MAG TPA: hypothetical protein VKO35_10910 [Acidimicrobiia bacterium]|nr:hypothetical protein [Acidimicrobiia bacterium]